MPARHDGVGHARDERAERKRASCGGLLRSAAKTKMAALDLAAWKRNACAP